MEKTLSIIKPDAIRQQLLPAIYQRFYDSGFEIIAAKMKLLTKQEAEGFYAEHKGKPFFNDLVEFMTSGPVMIQVLNKESAISDYRMLMGATNPENANIGTLRHDFASSMQRNVVHGSDSQESAIREIAYFFQNEELIHQR